MPTPTPRTDPSPLLQLTTPVGPRDHLRGNPDAPATLVEYGDYECPYCGEAFLRLREVERRVGSEARFVFRHFPLTQIHPHAERAAEAAEAAGAQGQFWQMHELLYTHQSALELSALRGYAEALGLDLARWDREMEGRVHAPRVREDVMSGLRSGVNGTPNYFLNGRRYDGPTDVEALINALRRAGA